MTETLQGLLDFCKSNGRVCPMPQRWNELWEMLPNRTRVGAGWKPALPLILAAWHEAPFLTKMLRLQEHIEWADKHASLDAISIFLRGLPETEWLHVDD
jgi:hypothetical protein